MQRYRIRKYLKPVNIIKFYFTGHQKFVKTYQNVNTTNKIQKPKRVRTAFTTDQVLILEEVYKQQLYVSKSEREILTSRLGLPDRAIKVWFQNRRMKGKKNAQESYDSSSVDSTTAEVIDSITREIQQQGLVNDYISVPSDICDELGQLINECLPKEFIDQLDSSLENSSMESTSPTLQSIDIKDTTQINTVHTEVKQVETIKEINYDNTTYLQYEPISPAEEGLIELPIWKPEEMKSIFDKHFC